MNKSFVFCPTAWFFCARRVRAAGAPIAPQRRARAADSGALRLLGPPRQMRDERLWKKAQEIHRKALVLDGHNDITEIMVDTGYDLGTPSEGKYHTDLARLVRSGMTGQFFSVYVDRKYATAGGSARRALDWIDVITVAESTEPARWPTRRRHPPR